MAVTLGYWDVRGRADSIRLLLVHSEDTFEDKRFTDPKEWFGMKFNMGLDFPNLPYLIDGDFKLTQTIAILRYLGRKYGYAGKTEEEIISLDLVEQTLEDVSRLLGKTWWDHEHFEEAVERLHKSLPPILTQLGQFLGDQEYILGDRISYADFYMYSILDYIRLFKPEFLENEDALRSFLERIESQPAINSYINSDKFNRWPITSPQAKWGFNEE